MTDDTPEGFSNRPNKWLQGCGIALLVLFGIVVLFLGTCFLMLAQR